MALERTPSLRQGVFWIDVFRPPPLGPKPSAGPGSVDSEPTFRDWVRENDSKVKILKRETHTADNQPLRNWYLFQVLETGASKFPAVQLGFPTIVKLGAPEAIPPGSAPTQLTSEETAQTPPPEPLLDPAPLIAGIVTAGAIIGGAILLPGLLGLLLRRR